MSNEVSISIEKILAYTQEELNEARSQLILMRVAIDQQNEKIKELMEGDEESGSSTV